MDYVGLDVHKSKTQICIDEDGKELVEVRLETHRESFRRVFGERERCRMLLEASTESEWVARCLEELGHEVIVADPNFAPMYATRTRRVKTDRRDARALCEACRLGAYRPAHRSSDVSRKLRAEVAVREALVTSRTKFISVVRATLRAQGLRVPSGGAPTFVKRVHALDLPIELQKTVQPLLTSLEQLNEQIEQCNQSLEAQAKDHPVVRRLMTVPSVGVLTALMFWAVVDDVHRFGSAKQVRGYLGLVPREWSSGETTMRGRLTKVGNRRLRSLLVEAAWGMLRRPHPHTESLRAWALRIAVRRGKRIAVTALARKLAGVLYAMWRDQTEFQSHTTKVTVPQAA